MPTVFVDVLLIISVLYYLFIYWVVQKRPEVCVTITARVLYLEKFPFAHL